jgi:cytochrome P450
MYDIGRTAPREAGILPNVAEQGFYDPAVLECPYPFYEELRSAPVCEVEGVGYLVSRYEDVLAVLRDPETFSSAYNTGFATTRLTLNSRPPSVDAILALGYEETPALAHTDGAMHRRHRSLVNPGFRPRRVAQLEPVILSVTDDLIDQFIGRGHVELVTEFTGPLPLTLTAEALGVTREDLPLFREWSDAIGGIRGRYVPEDEFVERAHKYLAFQQYFGALADDRAAHPQDDLITDIVTARTDDQAPLTKGELMNVFAQLLLAGNETTSSTLASGMFMLSTDEGLQQSLRQEPSRISSFVEEVLRIASPVLGLPRVVTRDAEIGSVPIPAGSKVLVMFGSANRDEDTFENAEEIDFERPNLRNHVAFGSGLHLCIGAPLARAELRIGLERLIARLGDFRVAPGFVPEPIGGPMLRKLRRLDLVFAAGGA